MPVKLYETLFALDATKVSADGDAVRHAVHAHLEKFGATIEVARPWDENGKLSYPIKKHKKAYFYIVYYRMDSLKQVELERDLQLDDNVIRQLTMLVEPKWSDAVMEVARTETGGRFALKGMHEEAAPDGSGIVSNDPLSRGEMVGGDGDGGPPRGAGPRGPAGAARAPRPAGPGRGRGREAGLAPTDLAAPRPRDVISPVTTPRYPLTPSHTVCSSSGVGRAEASHGVLE